MAHEQGLEAESGSQFPPLNIIYNVPNTSHRFKLEPSYSLLDCPTLPNSLNFPTIETSNLPHIWSSTTIPLTSITKKCLISRLVGLIVLVQISNRTEGDQFP